MTPCPKCEGVLSDRCPLCAGAGDVPPDRADRFERCARLIAHLRAAGTLGDRKWPETLGLTLPQSHQLVAGVLPEPDLRRIEEAQGLA